MVPSTVAAQLDTTAMNSELPNAPSMSWSCSSTSYQCQVKPTHSALRRESLNEYTTTIASGKYRKAYTASAAAHSPQPLRIAASCRAQPCRRPHCEQHGDGEHDGKR